MPPARACAANALKRSCATGNAYLSRISVSIHAQASRAQSVSAPRRMAIDVVDEAHADLVVGHLPLELVELQLRSMLLRQRTEFVEVIFEPVGKEQRVAVARQPEGRAARRARRGFAGRRVRVAVSGDGRVDGRKRLLNLAVGPRSRNACHSNSSPAAPDGCIVRSCRPSPAGAMSRITRRSEQSGSSATSSVAARGNPQTSGAAPAARNTARGGRAARAAAAGETTGRRPRCGRRWRSSTRASSRERPETGPR